MIDSANINIDALTSICEIFFPRNVLFQYETEEI